MAFFNRFDQFTRCCFYPTTSIIKDHPPRMNRSNDVVDGKLQNSESLKFVKKLVHMP